MSEVEIIRYQVLIPVTEVQVRSVGSGRDSANSMDGSTFGASISPSLQASSCNDTTGPSNEEASATSTGSVTAQFIWELIHLRCTQGPGGTQRRTEKIYQLSNR